jgi:hypothetical protein
VSIVIALRMTMLRWYARRSLFTSLLVVVRYDAAVLHVDDALGLLRQV